MEATDAWDLGVTCRCLTEDLAFLQSACLAPLEAPADNVVIGTFMQRRSQAPDGQETIQELQPRLMAYSLHVGRYRGATWHDRQSAVCWLLAVGIHREDSKHDAYAYFGSLLQADRLLPTVQDVVRALARRQPKFESILTEEIPGLRRLAQQSPGQICEAVLGNLVRVRLVFENGDLGILTVAISSDLLPEGPAVPKGWYELLLAAFLPSTESLDIAFDLAGQPLQPDENAFCGLVAH